MSTTTPPVHFPKLKRGEVPQREPADMAAYLMHVLGTDEGATNHVRLQLAPYQWRSKSAVVVYWKEVTQALQRIHNEKRQAGYEKKALIDHREQRHFEKMTQFLTTATDAGTVESLVLTALERLIELNDLEAVGEYERGKYTAMHKLYHQTEQIERARRAIVEGGDHDEAWRREFYRTK